MSSRSGFFITFEGGEACGKSTQIRLLAKCLADTNRPPVLVREPGGTPPGEEIRHLLQHSKAGASLSAETELLLFAASRAQLVREVILPSLANGRVVISDRFHDSTTVYQGVARRLHSESVAVINDFAVGGCVPDVTFLIDLPFETALSRMENRGGPPDRMEAQPREFHEAVRSGYLELAGRNPARFVVIDGNRPPMEIHSAILEVLERNPAWQC